jgi:hypothetical protein
VDAGSAGDEPVGAAQVDRHALTLFPDSGPVGKVPID